MGTFYWKWTTPTGLIGACGSLLDVRAARKSCPIPRDERLKCEAISEEEYDETVFDLQFEDGEWVQ